MRSGAAALTTWQKQLIALGGLLLALPGFPLLLGFLCMALLMVFDGSSELQISLASFVIGAGSAGLGIAVFWHAYQSLQGKASWPFHLPVPWVLAVFGSFLLMGWFVTAQDFAAALFFPPLVVGAALLPPLAALAWFLGGENKVLTWRRGMVAFAGGATVSVVLAILLQILMVGLVLALVSDLGHRVSSQLEVGMNGVLSGSGFAYLLVQVALIAPIAEELAKPVVVLPLAKSLSRRQAFLIGAAAGAGLTTIESIVYAGLGSPFWAGILLVQALGAAIQPLGSGLVAVGWRDVWQREAEAWPGWLKRFGAAVGLHAAWNAGSLLLIALARVQFFGPGPGPGPLGLVAMSGTLVLLAVLGLIALWAGRVIVQDREFLASRGPASPGPQFDQSSRAMAIWAVTCLVVAVPLGLASLQLLLGD